MQIKLEQITFDFDPKRSAKEPLGVVKDAMETGTSRDQKNGTSFNAEDFVITYGRSKGSVPEVRIKFSCPDLSLARAEIQAIAAEKNVLGDIPITGITFDNSGKGDELTLSFPNSTVEDGVQHNLIAWEWQFRTADMQNWIPFGSTRHRVYCIFAIPTDPWNKTPIVEGVLKHACNWSKGAQDEVTAATNITKAVFGLGEQGKVGYYHMATYAKKLFDCDSFLDLLETGVGVSQRLNCDDCATVVSTFGNILGCDLNQSEMRGFFDTNFVRLIGKTGFRPTGFDRHAVAWKDECNVNDPLYDACLQIDADRLPAEPDHEARQPTNIRFGASQSAENEYKFCLVSLDTGYPCNPRPQYKTRRLLGKSYVGQRREDDELHLSVLKFRYEFEFIPDGEKIGLFTPKLPLENFVLAHPAFAGWKFLRVDKFQDHDLDSVDQVTLLFSEINPAQMVEINVYICADSASPKDFLLQLLAQSNSMEIRRANSDLIGAVVFTLPDQTMHIVKYHQLIGLVRSVGKIPISTIKTVKAVEDYFVRLRSGDTSSNSSTTSTAFRTKDNLTTGGLNMAHRFGFVWTTHLLDDDGGVERQGHMDLSTMEPTGRLDNGRFFLPQGGVRRLEGQAIGNSIVLREFDNGGIHRVTYTGELGYEDRLMRMVIVGTRHPEGVVNADDNDIKQQQDSPWVITKP